MAPPSDALDPDRFAEALARGGFLAPRDRVVVGFSGGADSTALLTLLARARDLGRNRYRPGPGAFELRAAHLEHGLRGEDSARDEAFCVETCRRLGVPLALDERREFRLDGNGNGNGNGNESGSGDGASRETAARRARYRFFEHVCRSLGADRLALAHHTDDQAETVVARAVTGTGPLGLAGIPVRRPLTAQARTEIVRPFLALGIDRRTLVEWLEREGLPWREDASNRSLASQRNRIRLQTIPALAAVSGPGRATLSRLASTAERFRSAVDRAATALLHEVPNDTRVELHLSESTRVPPPVLERALVLAARRVGARHVSADATERLLAMAQGTSIAALELRGAVRVSRRGSVLRFEENPFAGAGTRGARSARNGLAGETPPPEVIELGGADGAAARVRLGDTTFRIGLRITPREAEPRHVEEARTGGLEEAFDAGAIRLPLRVRTWRRGDRIDLEHGGRQKLQDVFVDRKVPREERSRVPILVDGDDRVLWAIGVRRSAIGRIKNERTRTVVRVRYEADQDSVGRAIRGGGRSGDRPSP